MGISLSLFGSGRDTANLGGGVNSLGLFGTFALALDFIDLTRSPHPLSSQNFSAALSRFPKTNRFIDLTMRLLVIEIMVMKRVVEDRGNSLAVTALACMAHKNPRCFQTD